MHHSGQEIVIHKGNERKLDPYQEKIISETALFLASENSVIVQSETGSGKCFAKDTEILMYDGTVKKIQDIEAFDLIMGNDSTPRMVKSLANGKEMMYKITPTKGESYTVNESHILALKMTKDTAFKPTRLKNGECLYPGDFLNISVKDYLNQSFSIKHRAKGYRVGVDFNCEKNELLFIDPYFLGLWLGDGNSRNVSITSGDIEIEEAIIDFCEKNECNYRKEYNSVNSYNYHIFDIKHTGRSGNGIRSVFKDYNLFENKHIPHCYKTSSLENRLKLIAGLIDSDGSLGTKCYDVILKNEILSNDLVFICRSVGLAAYIKKCKKKCHNNGVVGDYFRISISGNINKIPCKLKRKISEDRAQIKDVLVHGIKVEKVGYGDYYGFEITGNRLFLLSDFTVVHNTVIFSTIVKRYLDKSDKSTIIFVHRGELLEQTRKALLDWYGIISQRIDADTKTINTSVRCYVAMVETFDRRSSNSHFMKNFENIGLSIYDECHIGNFKKLYPSFILSKRIGFTATPVSAVKKDPLLNYYKGIVIGIAPKELIEINRVNPNRGITECIEYSLQNINRSELKKKSNGEFDDDAMGEAFSKKQQIQNTISAYIKYAYGKKTICFNANIKHSILVTEAFKAQGFNVRHLNGKMSGEYSKYGTEEYRKDCFAWLRSTPNAILCNVGIATTGFDEPSIECVITNKSTNSISLFRQIRGRGGRPFLREDGSYKDYFIHLDMGDNIVGGGHGEWTDTVDWKTLFYSPKLPKPGVSSIKNCPECGSINHATARICCGKVMEFVTEELRDCGYIFPLETKEEDEIVREVVRISSSIDVSKTIEFFAHRAEYYSYFELYRQLSNATRKEIHDSSLDSIQLQEIYRMFYAKITQWFKMQGKRKFPNFRETVRDKMLGSLKDAGFAIMPEDAALIQLN